MKVGVYSGAEGQPTAMESPAVLDAYIAKVGHKPDIVMDYSNLTDPLLTPERAANVKAHGVTPMITWQLYESGWGGPDTSLADIANGLYNRQITDAAILAADLAFPILIRFAHEMNGDWYPWGGRNPAAYRWAFRRCVTIFRQMGATNVKWVWCPNVDNGDHPFADYYPGDDVVDYAGLDGYNWGGDRWARLYRVFRRSYRLIETLTDKPQMICETSCSENGGNKAGWISQGFATIPIGLPRVKAVIWYDRKQEDDWRVDSSPASLDAYRTAISKAPYA